MAADPSSCGNKRWEGGGKCSISEEQTNAEGEGVGWLWGLVGCTRLAGQWAGRICLPDRH